MSLIERAAKRLEELRESGIEIPTTDIENGRERQAARRITAPFSPESVQAAHRSKPTDLDHDSRAEKSPRLPQFDLDVQKLASEGFVTPDNPRSRIAEEFRNLKRTLIANASGKTLAPVKDGKLVMVTSALPGEGKTFSTLNLAMSIAMEMDHSVLLVDADVARPSLPRVLGLPANRGLQDLLLDPSLDLDEVLVHTSVKKLTVLTSGTSHANATELIASDAMTDLLAEISHRFPDKIVLFDSPPLLPTTESRVLATNMGQIVFVVRAGVTLQRDVLHALTMIESCPVKMMLLNQAAPGKHGEYGYGYGYAAQN